MLPRTLLAPLLPLAAGVLPSVLAKTVYNGNKVNGSPVIEYLDTKDLESSKVHRFYLRAGSLNSGHPLYVPVWIARGAAAVEDGKTLWVSSVVHGDELNGVRVAQLLLGDLEKTVENGTLNGTVIGVPGVNMLGMSANSRYVPNSSSRSLIDPNRLFPGVNASSGGSFVEDFVYSVWFGLTANGTQVDVAVDMHTQSTGGNTPFWVTPTGAYRRSRSCPSSQPSNSSRLTRVSREVWRRRLSSTGSPPLPSRSRMPRSGRRSTSSGRTSSSFKLWMHGASWRSRKALRRRPTTIRRAHTNTFVAHQTSQVGWWDAYVEPEDDVEAGQVLGKLYNSWGDELETVRAKASGKVHTVSALYTTIPTSADPTREAGSEIVRLIRNGTASRL